MKNNTYMYALLLSVTLNVTAYTQEPPVLTSVSPAYGFDSGGIGVTILGSNFQNDVILTFGDSAAVNLVRLDSTRIRVDTPAHPAGIVDVIVTNSDGQADTLFNGFEYILTLFGRPTHYATMGEAAYLFSADLDGDGDSDLAVTNYNTNNMSVFLNNGDGTFALRTDYPAGNRPAGIFSADLDGDGDNDLAVAVNGDTDVSVFLNNGDGTFAPKVDYPVGVAVVVFSIDLDGDGDNDLAVTNCGSCGCVSVLLNNGDGTFAPKVDYAIGNCRWKISSADVDGDGDNDLAVGGDGVNVIVLLNNGDGTFAPNVYHNTGSEPSSVFLADLDGDADQDLASYSWRSNSVSVLLNNGDGTFAPRVFYSTGSEPSGLTSADFDGDGDQDLVTSNWKGNSVSVLLNNGDGTFAPRVDYFIGSGPQPIVSADFDGDGDQDLAVGLLSGNTISVMLNRTIISPLGVNDREGLSSVPEIYSLSQNYPNPFNPTTTISYSLDKDSEVEVNIFDISGKLITTLRNKYQTQGEHSITWNGIDASGSKVGAGVYFYQMKAGDLIQTKKMVLLK